MLDDNQLKDIVKNARDGIIKRNFTQSAELTLILTVSYTHLTLPTNREV